MTRQLVLLLPGQGSQHQGMAVPLYDREPVFTEVLDEFFAGMGAEGRRLRDDWLSDAPEIPIDDGPRAQPLLFVIGYAIGRVLQAKGHQPALLLGHSVGELAAAALAGVYDLPAAARILHGRSAALTDAPAGGMLAVAAPPDRVTALIEPAWAARGLAIGAVNGPNQTILSGAEPELRLAARAAEAAELTARRVLSMQPFHSPVLDEAAGQFEKAIAAERLHEPKIPILSARTARVVTAGEAVDPAFWARLMCEPVLFWPALSSLPADGEYTFAEAGPGNSLSTAARRLPSVRTGRSRVLTLLPPQGKPAWPVWQAGLDQLAADTTPSPQ
ncbi:acyltransferase domain-containing protein [Lentzea tibetensis]|uniref:Acyltransferase domain-containing protein n=1 Tax=Lentzea tibetensis TaxID=2591470 RepID=A0A563ES30_9PSEU|nr:acyltransferase domain-containing protein [Lentzea tibetensis]TWP50507.1 acyltransferase domain-containing protein [Lentzea tibetensis]